MLLVTIGLTDYSDLCNYTFRQKVNIYNEATLLSNPLIFRKQFERS